MMQKMSQMSLTEFDKQKAREMMDKDHDGKCDFCGMPVEMCIDSGELECGMNPDAKTGKLGSQHIHADWKVYVNGKSLDFTPIGDRHERQMHGDTTINDTSAFIHMHPAEEPEKAGDVLHMHATGIPLSIFFESVGIKFDNKCLSLKDKKYCSDQKNSLKFYANGKRNDKYGD